MTEKNEWSSIEKEIISELRDEFIVDATDRLDTLEAVLDKAFADGGGESETLSTIRREAHSIKGMGGSFGFPLITSVAHRLEDYLSGAKSLDDGSLHACLLFIEVMREVVEDGENPDEALSELVLKKLPTKWAPSPSSQKSLGYNWEVMLGIGSSVLRTVVGKEISTMGCRALSARTSFEIIQLAVTNKPNAIIMTTVMEGLWGVDVARALGAMQATRDIPIGLLTSFRDEKVGSLPGNTILIHEDPASLKTGLRILFDGMKAREDNKVQRIA